MQQDIFETKTSADSSEDNINSNSIVRALLNKRQGLIKELKQIDEAITKVREDYAKRLDELQVQKKPIDDALQHLEALLNYEGWAASSADLDRVEGDTRISITDAAFQLLEEIHEPLHFKEITNRLLERGVYISGQDPSATLLSRISRDTKRFKRTKRGTYGLKGWRLKTSSSKTKRKSKRKNAE